MAVSGELTGSCVDTWTLRASNDAAFSAARAGDANTTIEPTINQPINGFIFSPFCPVHDKTTFLRASGSSLSTKREWDPLLPSRPGTLKNRHVSIFFAWLHLQYLREVDFPRQSWEFRPSKPTGPMDALRRRPEHLGGHCKEFSAASAAAEAAKKVLEVLQGVFNGLWWKPLKIAFSGFRLV
ncbi:MAG TPA: hypothetical protein VE685_21520 [Thermoanaerobaculia bacterium]|nr:hypothetical protein [Thermoanaerobaculia bacterium]